MKLARCAFPRDIRMMVVHTPNEIKDTPARVASLGCQMTQIKLYRMGLGHAPSNLAKSIDTAARRKVGRRREPGTARACDGPPEQEISAQSERRWRCHVFFWAGAQCIIVIKYSEKTTHTENQNHTPNCHIKGKSIVDLSIMVFSDQSSQLLATCFPADSFVNKCRRSGNSPPGASGGAGLATAAVPRSGLLRFDGCANARRRFRVLRAGAARS